MTQANHSAQRTCLNPDCARYVQTIGVCVYCANHRYNPHRRGVETRGIETGGHEMNRGTRL